MSTTHINNPYHTHINTSHPYQHRDTAGQERYASLAPLYYRGAAAALVVFDITQEDTFEKAKYWVTELQKNTTGDLGM